MQPICFPIHTTMSASCSSNRRTLSNTLRATASWEHSDDPGRGRVPLPSLSSLEAVSHMPFLCRGRWPCFTLSAPWRTPHSLLVISHRLQFTGGPQEELVDGLDHCASSVTLLPQSQSVFPLLSCLSLGLTSWTRFSRHCSSTLPHPHLHWSQGHLRSPFPTCSLGAVFRIGISWGTIQLYCVQACISHLILWSSDT